LQEFTPGGTVLQVSPVRAFADNYIWLIHAPSDPATVVVVDPGDAAPVKAELDDRGLKLAAIFATHHHPDHVGGAAELADRAGAPVFGPAREAIPSIKRKLGERDQVDLPELGLHFTVLDIPGHTSGHIAFVGHGAVFCGDTLFSAGCGRLFEGTAEQMLTSLNKLKALPPRTHVFCGHEYTLSNLRFAKAVEPANTAVDRHIEQCSELRERNEPTLPSTIELEHAINPFLRCDVESVKQAAEAHAGRKLHSQVDIFAVHREWKNGFKG
jgi:hydroxyacylglutathione hydrolase